MRQGTAILVFLLIGWSISCNNRKEPDNNRALKDAPGPKLPPKDSIVVNDDNIIKVSARQLSADYIANEIKADNDYKGNLLIVKGTIQEITRGITGNIYIILTGSNRMRTVFCYFNDEQKAARLKKGQVVSFKGYCEGLMASIILNNCQLVEN